MNNLKFLENCILDRVKEIRENENKLQKKKVKFYDYSENRFCKEHNGDNIYISSDKFK